jgi:tetratricopeptide (TPR) repeat protein
MADEPAQAQRCFLKAGAAFFQQGRAQEAWELYERVVRQDPNQLDALRGLVELAHINGEKAKMAHWGCELGDVLLARERYADAKVQFERVLAFDPENPKARSRLRRLNAIAGMSEASFGELAPAAGEVQGAQVTVRDEETEGSQSAFDLSQILDEFRSAVVDRIPPEDGQSHYDLGMTYREMGLLQEAAVEFEAAAAHEENRSSSLEMLGECYLELDQSEDAVRVLEQVLPLADDETRAMTHLRLGKAREALGEWDRAEEDYYLALELNSELTEANELLARLERRREQGAA